MSSRYHCILLNNVFYKPHYWSNGLELAYMYERLRTPGSAREHQRALMGTREYLRALKATIVTHTSANLWKPSDFCLIIWTSYTANLSVSRLRFSRSEIKKYRKKCYNLRICAIWRSSYNYVFNGTSWVRFLWFLSSFLRNNSTGGYF